MAEANAKPEKSTSQVEVVDEHAHLFHPLDLSEKSAEASTDKEKEVEQKLQELLKSISDETSQLGKCIVEESKLVSEICVSLKQILKKLCISFSIPPQDLPLKRAARKAILNEEGYLVLIDEKGEANSTLLADCPPEMVMAVFWTIVPDLSRTITRYRKRISTRVGFFTKLKKELQGAADAVSENKEQPAVAGPPPTKEESKS